MKNLVIELAYALVFALSGIAIFGVAYFSYVNGSMTNIGQTVLLFALIGLFATLYLGSKNTYIAKTA